MFAAVWAFAILELRQKTAVCKPANAELIETYDPMPLAIGVALQFASDARGDPPVDG